MSSSEKPGGKKDTVSINGILSVLTVKASKDKNLREYIPNEFVSAREDDTEGDFRPVCPFLAIIERNKIEDDENVDGN